MKTANDIITHQNFRVPPQSIEAEESLLCAILLDNNELPQIREILEPDDFYRTTHRKIFAAILELADHEEPIDLVTLANCLKAKNQLEEVGGASYLAVLVDAVPMAVNALHYAKIVNKKRSRRLFIEWANVLSGLAHDDSIELDIILAKNSEFSSTIMARASKGSRMQKMDISFEDIQSHFSTLVETPFGSINNIISGIAAGEMVIVGARTGVGKTALVLQFLRHTAIKQNRPVAYFGTLMDKYRIYARLVAQECQLSLRKEIMGGRILDEDKVKSRLQAQKRINTAPIHDHIISQEISLLDLQSMIISKQNQIGQNFALIIIENLQQIDWPGKKFRNKWERAGFVYKKLRQFCYEINSPIMVSSQLKKKVEEREDQTPMVSDLFDEEPESLSDLIFLLYRPNYHKKKTIKEKEQPEDDAKIIIAKGGQPIALPFTFWGDGLIWEEI